jgi:hypothetical protein
MKQVLIMCCVLLCWQLLGMPYLCRVDRSATQYRRVIDNQRRLEKRYLCIKFALVQDASMPLLYLKSPSSPLADVGKRAGYLVTSEPGLRRRMRA